MDDIPLLHDLYVAMSRALPRALRGYLDPTLILLLALALGVLARFTVFRWLKRLTAATKSPYDDIIVANLTRRVIAWTILGTAYWQMEEMPWRPRMIAWGQDIVAALLVISVTLTLLRMVSASVTAYGHTRAAGVGGTTLVRYIAGAVLLFIGTVSVLALFDVSVVPAITALGIGGLAVALAFQDTLANVFSGLNLTLSRQIRVGEYVELEGLAIEGHVVDIGWRATTLRAMTGLQIFIPNKKLAEAVMINYTRPSTRVSVELQFPVPHTCDTERVEAGLRRAQREVVPVVRARARRERERVRERLRGFGARGVVVEHRGQVHPRVRVARVRGDRTLERRARCRDVARGVLDEAEQVQRVGRSRRERERGIRLGAGFRQALRGEVVRRRAQVRDRIRHVSIQPVIA